MIWVIVVVIVLYLLYRFFSAYHRDNYDLQSQSLSEKFKFITDVINEYAFKGKGTVHVLDKRSFNLYKEDENQIIHFTYATGNLTITWKYKYFQKEVVHERQFDDVRNISVFIQQKIATEMMADMEAKVQKHKEDVLLEAGYLERQPQKGMTAGQFIQMQARVEDVFREAIAQRIASHKGASVERKRTMAFSAAQDTAKMMIGNYADIRNEFAENSVEFMTDQKYYKLIVDCHKTIIGEIFDSQF